MKTSETILVYNTHSLVKKSPDGQFINTTDRLSVPPIISLRELIAASHAIEEAEEIIQSVKEALKDWQKVAKRLGAQERDINLFSQRFITE